MKPESRVPVGLSSSRKLSGNSMKFPYTPHPKPHTLDYAPRINDAIRAMAAVERRSQLDVLSDLLDSIPNVEIRVMVTQIKPEKTPKTIVIMGELWGKVRKIDAHPSESDYALAVEAYQGSISLL
ncbi:MAG: hypothetical protein F6J93_36070 [Oscillatoria sp. SIO1A7]|nr:hypothetical protein [Oscillatoria sp. SIO1A7]